jgi:glycosyltransferase involved in cell wall biosynthesis
VSPLAPPAAGRHRIVFLAGSNADWGGASRVLFNTLRAIDRTRFEPVVLLSRPGPGAAVLDDLGIAYRIWRPLPDPEHGLIRYVTGLVQALRALRALGAELLDVNYNFWRPAEVLAARLLGIPVVTHFHAVVPSAGPFLRFSSAIAAVSGYVARHSMSGGRPVEVIPNTVTLGRFDMAASLRVELGIGESQVVVSFVGQIRENKGIDAFLRVAHAIDNPDVRFLVAGECRDAKRYAGAYDVERLRREIGGDERILYIGYRRDVENVFRTSDVLVVPSRWGEPFGLINIEAGAVGIPVVATRDGGIPEVIRDGDTGLLVDVGDDEALIAAVRRLVESPELRARMGRRARAVVEADFTTAPVRKLERLYLELIRR